MLHRVQQLAQVRVSLFCETSELREGPELPIEHNLSIIECLHAGAGCIINEMNVKSRS